MRIWNREQALFALGKIAEWSLYILIFTLPFSKSFVEAMIVVCLAAVILKKVALREAPFRLTPVNIMAAVVVLAALPSFFNTAYMALSLKALFTKILKFTVLFLLAQEALNDRVKIRNFSIMALISCVVILIDAFIQYFVTHVDLLHSYPSFQFSLGSLMAPRLLGSQYAATFLGFPTASFPFPNDFASWILVMVFPVGMAAMFEKGRMMKRALLVAVFACLALFLILTKTRGAWLAFMAAIALAPFFGLSIRNIKKALAIFIVVVIAASPIILKKDVMNSIVAIAGVSERNILWSAGWKIFKEHPVVGSGVNTFFVNYMNVREDEYRGKKGSYAHNCYLQMACDTGAIGLVSFCAFAAILLWRARRIAISTTDIFLRYSQAGIALGLIAYLVQAFTDTNLYSLNLAALFWVMAGVLASAGNIASEKAV